MANDAFHEASEGPSRVSRVRDSFHAVKLAFFSGVLVLLTTPMWLTFVTPRGNGAVWLAMTLVAYVAEIVALVAIGRWAGRVDHEIISPGNARLALALLLGLVPLALLCAVSWWKTGERAWAAGGAGVALAVALYFGSVIDRLRRAHTDELQ